MRKWRLEDAEFSELAGITSDTARERRLFKNPRPGSVPRLWWPVEGEVFVPSGGLGPREVDVRSAASSEKFKIILVY